MKHIIHFSPDTLHIEMWGNFTFSDFHEFRQVLSAIKDSASRDNIHLNVKQLDSIDSAALGFLMMAHDIAKMLHRSLVFVAPQGQVQEALSEAARHNQIRIAA